MDNIIGIVKKEQVFNHLNSGDPYIKFTMETPGNDGRKSTHTDCYLHLNSNHPISAKKEVIYAISFRIKNDFSFSENLDKKWTTSIEFFLKNNYPVCMFKETEKKPITPIINLDTGLEIKKMSSSVFHMFLASVLNLEVSFGLLVYKSSSKEPTPIIYPYAL